MCASVRAHRPRCYIIHNTRAEALVSESRHPTAWTMNVVTGTGAGVLTIATGTTSAHHQPRLSSTTREPSDVYREGLKRCAQVPPVCRATSPRPSGGLTFARRRHSKSLDSPYLSRPRMKRRGAVSYDKNDAAAEYIRYLGKCGVVRISDR
jgi:hypothetical protein